MDQMTAAQEFKRSVRNALVTMRIKMRRWRSLGARGERVAARYLKNKKRMYIVERSARNAFGEIDLVAVNREKTHVIFVEVKTRTSHDAGHPAEAVTDDKQERITRIAMSYMKHHGLLDSCSARFDVVAVTWPQAGRPKVEHFENAFEAVGKFQLFS